MTIIKIYSSVGEHSKGYHKLCCCEYSLTHLLVNMKDASLLGAYLGESLGPRVYTHLAHAYTQVLCLNVYDANFQTCRKVKTVVQ
jgi:hypothetical protein